MGTKIFLTLVLTVFLCASQPTDVNLFGLANNIAYIVRVDDSTFVQIAPSNSSVFRFTVQVDSGSTISVISGHDTVITEVTRPDGATTTVYPNPSESFVTVDSEANRVFELFTVAGQRVLSYPLRQRTTTIQLPPLASGVYFWRVGGATGKITVLH